MFGGMKMADITGGCGIITAGLFFPGIRHFLTDCSYPAGRAMAGSGCSTDISVGGRYLFFSSRNELS